MKKESIFYSSRVLERVKRNFKNCQQTAELQQKIIEEAEPWMKLSYDELWSSMFGNTISRSHIVWTNGYCPSCRQDNPMYSWVIDPFKHPWKARCPHCNELFPKNDFYKYYLSGLDRAGVFQTSQADRLLLFNREHPEPDDPLYKYGVDDGEGYVDPQTGNRWRFIATYALYGQWKKLIVEGIEKLSNAYVATGCNEYARKAGILLDRVADLFPTFDYVKEGYVYEETGQNGYVATWHESNIEVKRMAISYDRVFDALKSDKGLVEFLSGKALNAGLSNKKTCFEDIQTNIENRIFMDAINNRHKIYLNFPGTDILVTIIKVIRYWPENIDEIEDAIAAIIKRVTAVDGVTGEKGLTAYSALSTSMLAEFINLFVLMEDEYLEKVVQKYPVLKETYKFFIDTWCLGKYYPQIGDTGEFAKPVSSYNGVKLETVQKLIIEPAMYSFLWKLYCITGDTSYIKIIYKSINCSSDNLPYDLTCENRDFIQRDIEKVISREGYLIESDSVNKQKWHLAILRSGKGADERCLWIEYDSRHEHGHFDGMNLGLFAKGLDLMPDFGYPPVSYGGWETKYVYWYKSTAAHNTVAVDGKNHLGSWEVNLAGETTLWAIGKGLKAIRISGPAIIGGKQFERTVSLIDISDKDSYIIDIFRVIGGKNHAKFMHSHFGSMTTKGLILKPAEEYGYGSIMRNFREDKNPVTGWSADWKIEDYYKILPEDSDIHLKYIDLTSGASVCTEEGWLTLGGFCSKDEKWIPGIMVGRASDNEPLASTFVSIIEPYEGKSNIKSVKCLQLEDNKGNEYADNAVAIVVNLEDGRRDIIVALDVENTCSPAECKSEKIAVQKELGLVLSGEFCMLSMRDQNIERAILCKGNSLKLNSNMLLLKKDADILEILVEDGETRVLTGDYDDIEKLEIV